MSMSVEQTRDTLMAYAQAILARKGYADFFSDDVRYIVMNTGEETRGRGAVEQRIEADHDLASALNLRTAFAGEGNAAVEVDFVTKQGTTIPYSVMYDLADGKITALRLYFAGDVPGITRSTT